MPIYCEQEGEATAIDTLEEGTLAESHHALSGTGEVLYNLPFVGSDSRCFGFVVEMYQTISRKFQFFHEGYHFGRVEATVLVAWSSLELNGTWQAFGEI